ncbi:heat-inducible transcriptional repressor HrcA [Candidatus Riflebacteria bacterium]
MLLHFICDHAIRTGQPISSRTLKKNYGLNISPATIRNEMSDLEDQGLLSQPHISAGRIPTEEGYRIYVKGLDKSCFLNKLEQNLVDKLCSMKATEEILLKAVRVISSLTLCPAFSVTLATERWNLKELKLIKVDTRRILAIFIDKQGEISSHVFECQFNVNSWELENISRYFNSELNSHSFAEVSIRALKDVKQLGVNYRKLVTAILELMKEKGEEQERELIVDGSTYFLDVPEFQNLEKLKEVLFLLNSKRELLELFRDTFQYDLESTYRKERTGASRVSVKIGRDLNNPSLKDLSFVSTYVDFGLQNKRTCMGLLGPIRMNYGKAISTLQVVTSRLFQLLFHP